MINRKTAFRFLVLAFLVVPWARGDDGNAAFCERARAEFNSLLRLCRTERKAYWNQRSSDAIARYNQKSWQLQSTSEFLGRQTNGKELKGIFAFEYLNQLNELQLNEATGLVEDLGHELVNDRFASQLEPKLKNAEAQFAALQGNTQPESVRSAYTHFLDLKREVARLEADAPIKESFTFEPRPYPFSSTPTKPAVYTIHDWNSVLAKVDELDQQFQQIQDTLQTLRFFAPKDPNYWVTLMTQLTFLMAAIPGWVKSYLSDKPSWPIIIFVVSSMLVSGFLVLYSAETFLNILRQSILPSFFVLYWIARRRGWLHWPTKRFRRLA